MKLKPCPYKGHRSYPATGIEFDNGNPARARRAQWRESKRRSRRSAKAIAVEINCAQCESPFLPDRRGQRYCQSSCRDRAKYLRRRSTP